MEKINVAKLLKDCPQNMELDCTMFNKVTLFTVDDREGVVFPIKVFREDGNPIVLTKYGQYTDADFAKCSIFPKGKTTWEGFVPPCQFKDGDVVAYNPEVGKTTIYIYRLHKVMNTSYYVALRAFQERLLIETNPNAALNGYNDTARLATEEEKAKLFQAIKDNGYKWNEETKTLEKLIEPKFKAGNKVRNKNNHNIVFTITSLEEDFYACGVAKAFGFDDQDDYELVPNKFDITTLKPFESRVLVRDKNTDEWRGHFFSHYNNNSHIPYICIGTEGINEYGQCIPFEGNEHLLGKTEDCIDFYKTWGKMTSVINWQTGMPEQTGLYLVTLSTGKVTAMVCHNRFASSPYWLGEENEEGTVIAWCKLSDIEPYKE